MSHIVSPQKYIEIPVDGNATCLEIGLLQI